MTTWKVGDVVRRVRNPELQSSAWIKGIRRGDVGVIVSYEDDKWIKVLYFHPVGVVASISLRQFYERFEVLNT